MDVTSGPTRVPVITSADAPSPSNPEDDDYLSALGTAPLTSLASNGVAPPRLTDRPPSMLPDPPNPSRKLGKRPEIESLDYDIDASTLFESDYSRQYSSERGIHVASKWVVCGLSGLMTGAIAFMLDIAATHIQAAKFSISALALDMSTSSAGDYAIAICCLAALSMLLVAFSSSLILFVEPIAGGSGIPEVKTYLQGCRIPRIFRVSTLTSKALGVLCSVSGGLVCGKEGPMIHIGASIAAGFSQGSSKTFRCRTAFLKRFRNDHDKRDFVSAGAAAGVAAAFGAPIGGVLFALEEAATHWSQQLTWRTFFCALCSTFCLNLMLTAVEFNGHSFGQLSHPGLFTFGSFLDCQSGQNSYLLSELVVFIVIGVACGFIGAAFNTLNVRLTKLRARHLRTKRSRLLEAISIAALTAINLTHRYVCGSDSGLESPLVRLLLAPHDMGIKILFHAPAAHGLSAQVCIIFFIYSFLFGLVTYGLALPSGLFVPCIMAGAAMGRMIGEWLGPFFGDTSPGNYALVGAAGMLGGICRMTISLTVIVIESTGNVVYSIPIALTIMFAKLVGDMFTEGIYDLHIGLKAYPTIPDQPPDSRAHLQASDVMARAVRTVSEYEQVGTLLKLLRSTQHNAFPVAAHGGGGGILGTILRDQLVTILSHPVGFEVRRSASPHLGSAFQQHAGPNSQMPPLSADDFLRPWTPTSLERLALAFTPEDLEKYVNLRPYINEAALVTLRTTSLRRVSRLFLTMGLRHLLVVESCPKVVGVITRKDIIYGGDERAPRPTDRLLRQPMLGGSDARGGEQTPDVM